MARRAYVNGAPLLTISGALTNISTAITVSSTSGYPGATPYTVALERGTVNEEVCLVTGVTGTTFTVTRGWDGTTAKAHSSGAILEHTSTASDYNDANAHVFDTTRDDHTQYTNKALFAAKGAILVSTSAATPAGFPVGADGTVLVANSANASGMNWVTISGSSITNGTIVLADLDTPTQQSVIQKLTTGTLPGAPPDGQLVWDGTAQRWVGGVGGSFVPLAWGVGRIWSSTGAPSGGANGDIWIQYV